MTNPSLLAQVHGALTMAGIPSALIGAAALAVHGVSRSTFDQDLLVMDERVLDTQTWDTLHGGASVDIRRGDADDPSLMPQDGFRQRRTRRRLLLRGRCRDDRHR